MVRVGEQARLRHPDNAAAGASESFEEVRSAYEVGAHTRLVLVAVLLVAVLLLLVLLLLVLVLQQHQHYQQ